MGYFMLQEQNKKNDLPVLSIMHTPHKRDAEHEEQTDFKEAMLNLEESQVSQS